MNKKVLYLVFCLSFFACKKETFNNDNVGKQNALVIYFGGSWCSPCGQYGKPTKEALHKKYGNKLSILSCQVNSTFFKDSMNTEATNKMAKVFPASGVPIWFTGGSESVFDNKFGAAINQNSISEKIDNILALNPKTIINTDYRLNNNKLIVNSKITFLSKHHAKEGQYFIAAYLTKNNLHYIQANDASTDKKNIHSQVLQKSFTDNIYGTSLGNNGFTKNSIVEKSLEIDFSVINGKSDYSVVLVVWKKLESDVYVASNTHYFNLK